MLNFKNKLAITAFAFAAISAAPHAAQAQNATQAVASNTFVDSLGINTHMIDYLYGSAYSNVWMTELQLAYLGIHYVRDCFCDNQSVAALRQMNALLGIKVNVVFSSASYDLALQTVTANPQMVAGVEGVNEADLFSPNFQNLSGLAAAVALQKQLYKDVRAVPALAWTPVESMSITKTQSVPELGDLGGITNYLSVHDYPQWYGVPGQSASTTIAINNNRMAPAAAAKPFIMTEGGYWTRPGPNGMTETAQAKSTLNFILGAFKQGVVRSYLYQLSDEYADPKGLKFNKHFGFFNVDGSAKQVAVAVHNTNMILADQGVNKAPAALQYTIDNLPSTASSLLMQKSNGTFVLAVWNDAPLWDNVHHVETPVADTKILINLGQQFKNVSVFDPIKGLQPVDQQTNISGLTEMLPDHPIFVLFK